jgi:hypothetical protein
MIISLTTLPNRHSNLKRNLSSLLQQDYKEFEVHLNVPITTQLNGVWKKELDIPIDSRLKVFYVEDIGAITKLFYTLKRTNGRIITVDDDFIYHPQMLNQYSQLIEQMPDAALGFAGIYPIGNPSNGDLHCIGCLSPGTFAKVGVLEGYKSVCYNSQWFDEQFFTEWAHKHYNDDLIISSWLGYKKIDRYVAPYSDETVFDNRTLSFPLVSVLNNSPSGQHHFRKQGGNAYKTFYNSLLGKYIK